MAATAAEGWLRRQVLGESSEPLRACSPAFLTYLTALVVGSGGIGALGGWLISLGIRSATAVCEVPLAIFAIVSGSFYLLVALLLASVLAVAFALTRHDPEAGRKKTEKEFSLQNVGEEEDEPETPSGACSRCKSLTPATSATSLGIAAVVIGGLLLGIQAWGSALLFGHDRWERMHASLESSGSAGGGAVELPCDRSLYLPQAILMLVFWSLLGVFVTLAFCCTSCILPVVAAVFCCGNSDGARRKGRRKAREPDAGTWRGDEGDSAPLRGRRDGAPAYA